MDLATKTPLRIYLLTVLKIIIIALTWAAID